jgi:hypothetical protein
MWIIPAAVHIRLRAEADDQPKGPSVITPHVGVGSGRGTLDCHHRVNLSKRLVSSDRGRGAEEGNIDQEEQHCSNDCGGAHSMDSRGHISRGEEAAGGDLSESMEEDITFDNEIATALLCARGDASTIDGNDTATITTAYTDSTGDYDCEDFESRCGKARRLTPAASKQLEANLKKEQDKVTKLLDMNIKVKFDLQAA